MQAVRTFRKQTNLIAKTRQGSRCGFVCLLTISCILVGCRPSTESWPQAIVAGNSMAPHFCGEHLEFTCDDCGFVFQTSTELPRTRRVVCPNCGYSDVPADRGVHREPQRYVIEPVGARPLARWAVVAINRSESSTTYHYVKRIIGMPGETISLVNGHLVVDGRVWTLDWPEIDDQKILVYDGAFEPKSMPGQRLTAEPADAWQQQGTRWISLPNKSGDATVPTLTYHHWKCYRHGGPRDEPGPIHDVYSFDQALSRTVNATEDSIIQLEITTDADSRIAVVRDFAGGRLEVVVSRPAGQVLVQRIDEGGAATHLQRASIPPNLSTERTTLEIATLAERVGIRLGGQPLAWVHWKSGSATAPSSRVMCLQVHSGSVTVDRLRIYRGIYWFDQLPGLRVPATESRVFSVPPGHYFVMGDNVPVSKDSRDWEVPYVPVEAISGFVRQLDRPANDGKNRGNPAAVFR